ncbi:hypothetical protein BaRGS_00013490, partial [Batillaria attramentaria]
MKDGRCTTVRRKMATFRFVLVVLLLLKVRSSSIASSASLSAASAAKVRCVIHFSATNEDEAICALTETTFDRILDFSNKWKRLVGAQGDVARVFVATSAELHVTVCMSLLTQVLDFTGNVTTDSLTQP